MNDKHTLKREQYIITGSRDFQDNIEIIDFCKTLDEAKTDLKYLKVLTNVSGYVEELFDDYGEDDDYDDILEAIGYLRNKNLFLTPDNYIVPYTNMKILEIKEVKIE